MVRASLRLALLSLCVELRRQRGKGGEGGQERCCWPRSRRERRNNEGRENSQSGAPTHAQWRYAARTSGADGGEGRARRRGSGTAVCAGAQPAAHSPRARTHGKSDASAARRIHHLQSCARRREGRGWGGGEEVRVVVPRRRRSAAAAASRNGSVGGGDNNVTKPTAGTHLLRPGIRAMPHHRHQQPTKGGRHPDTERRRR